jgi:hypothetical protein
MTGGKSAGLHCGRAWPVMPLRRSELPVILQVFDITGLCPLAVVSRRATTSPAFANIEPQPTSGQGARSGSAIRWPSSARNNRRPRLGRFNQMTQPPCPVSMGVSAGLVEEHLRFPVSGDDPGGIRRGPANSAAPPAGGLTPAAHHQGRGQQLLRRHRRYCPGPSIGRQPTAQPSAPPPPNTAELDTAGYR